MLLCLMPWQGVLAATWGEAEWGEAVWGGVAVPLDGGSLMVLALLLMLIAAIVRSRRARTLLAAAGLAASADALAATVQVPNVFSDGTVISADEMNENFDVLELAIETGLVGPEGPQGQTGPRGPEGPPGPQRPPILPTC
jgi:hypothetical protein